MAKKAEIVYCNNCGDPTSFPRHAEAERVTRGWCPPCMSQYRRITRVDSNGETYVKDERSMYARTPWNSRLDDTDDGPHVF